MNDPHHPSRRRFLQVSATAAASATLATGCGRFQPRRTFDDHERALVEAIADQIIPPDQDPGGKDAGVGHYIDLQLRGRLKRHRKTYREGLPKVDASARQLRGRPFAELGFDDQAAVLSALETGKVPAGIWQEGEAQRFFSLVLDHCLQGYYGSPRHGGNRDYVSWKMLKLDYPQVAGRVLP